MKLVRLVVHQLRYEQLSFWRNPAGVFFILGLPILMLAIFTTMNEGDVGAGGQSFGEYFVPGMVTFGLINAAYGNLAARTVLRRESGLLKRARATPVPPGALVAGLVVNAVVMAALITTVVLVVGRLFYDVPLPDRWGLFAAALVVGSAGFGCLGLAVATVVPNVEAADPIVFGTVLPLLFISGVFDQVPDGSVLDRVATAFPVRHLFDVALASAGPAGATTPAGSLAVVAAWGAAGAVVAVRRFRWEPNRR